MSDSERHSQVDDRTTQDTAEFDRVLDELAADLPSLPSNFSRAEIYGEHN